MIHQTHNIILIYCKLKESLLWFEQKSLAGKTECLYLNSSEIFIFNSSDAFFIKKE